MKHCYVWINMSWAVCHTYFYTINEYCFSPHLLFCISRYNIKKQILTYTNLTLTIGLLPYCNWKYIILQLSVVIRTDSLSAFWWKSKIRIQIVEKQLFQVTPWAKSKNEIKEAIGRPWHLITPPLWCFLHLDLN